MSRNINRVTLLGNLGQDPDVRQFPDGGAVVNFSLATNETWKDKNTGETKEKTQWHRIVVFGPGLIKVCQDYLKKGSRVFIEGTLENRSWTDQKGTERYTTEIVLRPYRGVLTLLDAKENGNGGNHADMPDDGYGPGPDDDEIPY